jgi:hypothetical protein
MESHAVRCSLVALALAVICAPRAAAQAPPSPRAAAGLDLTGTWVSVVTEDWRYRMVTPPKGDYTSVPLTPEARKVADTWDPARDEAAGEQCRSYGAPAVMRVPGRVRIAWEDDDTLKVEAEAGTQTRLLHFANAPRAGPANWQGSSQAQWIYSRQPGSGGTRRGHLKVVTTNLRPGYLRKNGVPYSADAVLTEYYNRLDEPNGDVWLVVTTMVDDPRYLNGRFATSTHFKKLPASDTRWTPERCSSR